MITDRNHMKEWREQLAMRQWVRITQLKRVTLPQVSLSSLMMIHPIVTLFLPLGPRCQGFSFRHHQRFHLDDNSQRSGKEPSNEPFNQL